MAARTPGPFEASGLPYSSSHSDASSTRPVEATALPELPLVEVDPSVFADEETPRAVAARVPPALPIGALLPRVPHHALSVPPSPKVVRPPRGPSASQWRTVIGSAVAATGVAMATMGIAWAFTRIPAPSLVASPGGDPVRDTPPISAAIAAGRSVPSPAAIESRAARSTATLRALRRQAQRDVAAADAAIRARSAAIPPPRRASTPSGSPVGIPVVAAPGQSCGQRCGTNIQCLLACRPQSTRANALVATEPTRDQVAQAMDSVRGAVLMCGISLPPNAPRTASVTVSFDGSGRATWASVAAPLQNTPAGDCIVRAAGRARVPPFERGPFVVHYPFVAR